MRRAHARRRALLLSPSLLPLPERQLVHFHLAQSSLHVPARVVWQRRRLGGLVRDGVGGTARAGWMMMRLLHRRQITRRNHRWRNSASSGRAVTAVCPRVDRRVRRRRGAGGGAGFGRERPGKRACSGRRQRPKRPLDSGIRHPLAGLKPLHLCRLRRTASIAVATTAGRACPPSRWREAQTGAAKLTVEPTWPVSTRRGSTRPSDSGR